MNVQNLTGYQLNEYRLRELLGEGGMSAVYRAEQTTLGRDVAIKVLPPALAQQPGYMERFTQEARIIASLEHPHIVPIYDYGEQGGITYLVMRMLTGGTLGDRLAHRLPSPGETAHMLNQVAGALDYAHSRGVIHRDMKPGNIMFDHRGVAYIVDFGIARLMGMGGRLTREVTFGTPWYMAPERWRDEEPTPETDQYALAAVIYTAVTGVSPFEAETPQASMYKHLNEMPRPPHELRPELPEALTPVFERALAKTPAERYLTITDFAEAFKSAIAGAEGQPVDFFTFPLPPRPVTTPPSVFPPVIPPAPPPDQPRPPRDAYREVQLPPPARRPRRERISPIKLLVIGGGLALAFILLLFLIGAEFIAPLLGRARATPTTVAATETPLPQVNTLVPIGPGALLPTETAVVEPTGANTTAPTAIVTATQNRPTPLPSPGVGALTRVAGGSGGFAELAILQNDGTNPVRSVAFSPGGNLLATGDGRGGIHIFDVGSGAQLAAFQGHQGTVHALDFSPDGTLLASTGEGSVVRLWEVQTAAQRSELRGHTAAGRTLAFSPDGTLLASGGEDNTIRLWNVATGSTQMVLSGHEGRVLSVAFSPDGTRLASGGGDATVRLWDIATGARQEVFRGHTDEVRRVAFSPDGSLLASAGADGDVRLWNIASGEAQVLQSHPSQIFSLAFSPAGNLLASGGRDNTIHVWEFTGGTPNEIAILAQHRGWVLDLAFSPDGTLLASGGGDGTARLWGLPTAG